MADLYIDGRWVPGTSGDTRQSINPADGSVVATVDEADADDAAAAVAAARRAFDSGAWPGTPVAERAATLNRIADLLQRDRDRIARIETLDTGKTLVEARQDIDDVTDVFRYYATLAPAQQPRRVYVGNDDVVSTVVREPIGVCSLIGPWNYPLLQISWKLAPALVAGCTTIVKPSEVTPLSTIELVRLVEEVGVPAGVVNLVLGAGATVGPALVEHEDVDMVSFTGGVVTGRTIMRAAAETVKRTALELGGKNPQVVFADVDVDLVADQVLTGVFLHAGQVCSAGTRLIVQRGVADELVGRVAARAERIVLGSGLDETSESGPLVSAAHREKVEEHVRVGLREGARLVTGGHRPEKASLADGFFYSPTIFDDCHTGMRIVQEETFGPILTVERFDTEDEAVALANDTDYGLAGGVWTRDEERGERVAAALRHGTVWINDFGYYVPGAEWGGYKRSGNGRELGPTGLEEFQETKHVWRNTKPAPAGWFRG
jgi:betaine-aldehyde dehydrogenase